jgi:pantoate--beta-alanine ligase
MNIVTEINAWRAIRRELAGKTIGLVHTMGNLHAGHMSLCERSTSENEITVAAIFINPMQFNEASDFARYPRTLLEDKALLASQKIDYLLLLDEQAIYPDHYQVQIVEHHLSKELEGEFRPGHFTGMLTVVLKFLNLVQPSRSYYGEKDFQQLLLIKKLAQALFLPYEIVGCPTIRAEDGLALSSRNTRLSKQQRDQAVSFPKWLKSALSPAQISEQLQALGFKVDYIADKWQRRLGAVWIDDIRLIDNIENL